MTVTSEGVADRFGATNWPGELREYQTRSLDALAKRLAGGRRAWLVLPPGAGKTLVALEAARRRGQRIVVFVPNTAIQAQWIRTWQGFTPQRITAGTARDLGDDVTVLTYQSLVLFDPELENGDRTHEKSLLEMLHAGGQALLKALRDAGPMTVVLDECHHLLETWGRVMADLLDELPDAHVIGLTATPPESLSAAQAELVARLFGTPIRGASLPAVVKDGYLATFAELAYITAPTPVEADYILGEAQRFAEFRGDLMDPEFAATPFLNWCDARYVTRAVADSEHAVSWSQLERDDPEQARAALRLHHAGLLALPQGAQLREEHRQDPAAEDWVALLDDYVGGCLRRSDDPRDGHAAEAIHAALPSIGYQLTQHGIRAARSPVDRVLSRSDAKTEAAVEIVAAECGELGDRLRALVLCDFEHATATLPARLTGVLDNQAGGARLLLERLVADERSEMLGPMLVTGKTVAGSHRTAEAFAAWANARNPVLRLAIGGEGAIGEVTGTWQSRTWVALVTEYFQSGECRVLVGTRALLGEGWDAPAVNTVIDLSSSTTVASIVQMRGRGLRLDPSWREKSANNWTVVCATDTHPMGAADWRRFVRKHEGYLAVNATGDVVSGVGHVDPAFSPHLPPPQDTFDNVNASMLVRAGQRNHTREQWAVGGDFTDELVHTIRVRGLRKPLTRPATEPRVPALLPAKAGLRIGRRRKKLLLLAPARAARLLDEAAGAPSITLFAYVVADALHECDLTPVGADAVEAHTEPDGAYRLQLAGVSTAASLRFTTALDELIAPISDPRWLMPRYEVAPLPQGGRARWAAAYRWLLGKAPYNTVVYHSVPAAFARSTKKLAAFTELWNRYVSEGEPVATASPEGQGILAAQHGANPLDAATALRVAWH